MWPWHWLHLLPLPPPHTPCPSHTNYPYQRTNPSFFRWAFHVLCCLPARPFFLSLHLFFPCLQKSAEKFLAQRAPSCSPRLKICFLLVCVVSSYSPCVSPSSCSHLAWLVFCSCVCPRSLEWRAHVLALLRSLVPSFVPGMDALSKCWNKGM